MKSMNNMLRKQRRENLFSQSFFLIIQSLFERKNKIYFLKQKENFFEINFKTILELIEIELISNNFFVFFSFGMFSHFQQQVVFRSLKK